MPKIMPNGAAPTIIGIVSRAPAVNSCQRLGEGEAKGCVPEQKVGKKRGPARPVVLVPGYFNGMGVAAGTGTALTLFFALPLITRSL